MSVLGLAGALLKVHVEEGQRVQQGDALVELEPFDLLQREQQAAESLAASEADYRRLSAGFREEEIAQAKARLSNTKHGTTCSSLDPVRKRLRRREAESQSRKVNRYSPSRTTIAASN